MHFGKLHSVQSLSWGNDNVILFSLSEVLQLSTDAADLMAGHLTV